VLKFEHKGLLSNFSDACGTIMASKRDEKQEDVRLRVMRLISADSEMSTREIADAVGISNGSAYYVLTALIEKGFVKLENFKKNPRKGQYAYLLTPKGIRERSLLTHKFIARKRQEFEDLRDEIKALEDEAGVGGETDAER
jgi:EPS-associated MarR family transcriptional regulator